MSKEYKKTDIGLIKPLDTLKGYNLAKDRYYVNTKGEVFLKKSNGLYHKMKPFITRDGYVEYVLLTNEGKKKHIQAQRLVALSFITNKKNKPHVNHKDGNRQNNNVTNLEWNTISENAKHSYDKLNKKPWNKK